MLKLYNVYNFRFIGEETLNTEDLSDAPTWIIDPIDGTTNFVHSDEHCVISVALAVNKQLEIGIVYSPIKDYMFCAQRGKGSWLNGKRIQVSSVTGNIELMIKEEILLDSDYLSLPFLYKYRERISERIVYQH